MSLSLPPSDRRLFLKATGTVAAASALANVAIPKVHAAEDSTVQVALIGCGGRGTGAASDALRTKSGPIKLVAMADVFESRLSTSHDNLKKEHQGLVDVPNDRKFIGFDGYKHAIDSLKPGDIAIMTTPPAFRWVFFKYAIEKGVNVFMEKPVTVDGPSSRKMLALNEEAKKKNLKVGVGLMCRHSLARGELAKRIKDGEMGDLIALRCYRMHGPVGFFSSGPKPDNISELMYQVQRFHSFLWASGGAFSDFYIHNIDECCWMKDSFPVQAQATGGRHYRGDSIDQNFDNYSVEYTFGDGAKLFMYGRCMPGCHDEFASFAHGSKGSALISSQGHFPAHTTIYKDQSFDKNKVQWAYEGNEPNPYHLEWEELVKAVREDKPYNEVERGVKASVVTSMGRMAAHTGQVITYDQMLNCEHEFAPGIEGFTKDSEAPLKAGPNGKYPVPQPGLNQEREFSA
jgi:predicted dehydrogenase